ncbi:hypothetical protein F4775DRAFT_552812 [Biscogniauxia sp. FL1348]|nr:hypothetical protein F4775DRAFT_552812 [Biscogniauxia sp. FL1348]
MSFTTPNSPTFSGGSSSLQQQQQHHHHHRSHRHHRQLHPINTHFTKRHWSEIEDKILKEAVSRHGVNQWDGVARLIWTKTADECRARWAELVPVLHENLAEKAAALGRRHSTTPTPYYSSSDEEDDDDNHTSINTKAKNSIAHRRRERRALDGAQTGEAQSSPATPQDASLSRVRRNTEPSQTRRTLSQRRSWRAPHPLMVPSSPPPVPKLVSSSTSITTSGSFSIPTTAVTSPRSSRAQSQQSSRNVSRNVSPIRITWAPEFNFNK